MSSKIQSTRSGNPVRRPAQPLLVELLIQTNDGAFRAHYSGKGLARLDFPKQPDCGPDSAGNPVPLQVRRWHRRTSIAVQCILAGRAPRILPPLDLSSGTPFRQRVWNTLRRIACGRTRSYGEIARQIGQPQAVRAVGGACGANPIPLLVPCHRVLAANGRIGGFSGGLHWKRKLLAREGIRFPAEAAEASTPDLPF